MAEDVNTILDIVKAVDEKRFLEEDHVDKALTQKDPVENLKKGGKFEGRIFYSNITPKGKGELPKYNKEIASLLREVKMPGASREKTKEAGDYLAGIGYLHPEQADGKKTPELLGAIYRHQYNTNKDPEAIWNAFKTWKDNLFDWAK